MPTTTDYKALEIYHDAHALVLEVYKLCEQLPKSEDNNLTSQLRRAATCLPLNIAEGSGAGSNKIFLNYLIFCYRSCLECEAALALCKDLKYLTLEDHDAMHEKLDRFIRRLYRYMQYIEEKCGRSKRDVSYFYRHQRYSVENNVKKREQMKSLA